MQIAVGDAARRVLRTLLICLLAPAAAGLAQDPLSGYTRSFFGEPAVTTARGACGQGMAPPGET